MYHIFVYLFACLGFFFLVFFGHTAHGILVLELRIEPGVALQWKDYLTSGPPRSIPIHSSADGHVGGLHILAAVRACNTAPYSFLNTLKLLYLVSHLESSRSKSFFPEATLPRF